MQNQSVKDIVRELVDRLPDNSTWDDVEYELYVRRAVDAGLADSDAEAVVSVSEVRRSFGLPERK